MRGWNDYFWPGTTVLINKPGLTDQTQLDQFEAFRAAVRDQEIRSGTVAIARTFDAKHLQALHGHLFVDVYDWAGQYREVEMSKGRLPFATLDRIESYLADTTHIIATTTWPELDRAAFVEQSAKVYSYVNSAHPFREGNGRAGKLLLSQVAEMTRYDLDYAKIDRALWNQQSQFSRPDLGQYTPHHHELVPVFDRITIDRPGPPPADPRFQAAREAAKFTRRDHPTHPRDATRAPEPTSRGAGTPPAPGRSPGPRPGRDTDDYGR